VTATDDRVRHVAVIMGSPASGRSLLGLLAPLFQGGGRFEVQGVFLEDADASHAAGLPFVKEVCRVTFSVREFTSDQFERSVALNVRTARRTFSVLAARTGLPHSFRNVRGSGSRVLGEAAAAADITVFEPAQLRLAALVRAVPGRQPQRRIMALLADAPSAPDVLATALQLAGGDSREITVLLAPDDGADTAELRDLVQRELPRMPAALRYLKGEPYAALCDEARASGATLAVLSARSALEQPGSLQLLRAGMPCPVCLVSHLAAREAA
jgi:hypothetical protein